MGTEREKEKKRTRKKEKRERNGMKRMKRRRRKSKGMERMEAREGEETYSDELVRYVNFLKILPTSSFPLPSETLLVFFVQTVPLMCRPQLF